MQSIRTPCLTLVALVLAACGDPPASPPEVVACPPVKARPAAVPPPAAAPVDSSPHLEPPPAKPAPPRVTFVEPESEPADLDAKLRVKRLVIAKGVANREPREPTTVFETKGERVYAFVEVGNADQIASEVAVRFAREGEPLGPPIRLRVGASARWRTWAFTRRATAPG
ncbi:MAG: hypothetical protein AAGA56_03830, partial [Myxococcota bacterium]